MQGYSNIPFRLQGTCIMHAADLDSTVNGLSCEATHALDRPGERHVHLYSHITLLAWVGGRTQGGQRACELHGACMMTAQERSVGCMLLDVDVKPHQKQWWQGEQISG